MRGVNDRKYPSWDGKKILKEYDLWRSLIARCSQKIWDKHPTYKGTHFSDNFSNYSFFYEWCQTHAGFCNKDEKGRYWHLDKDLLIKGNKLYSEDTCVFLPTELNKLLTKRDNQRGDFPVGVSWDKSTKKFQANCNKGGGKQQYLGLFSTPQEAFQAYKEHKEAYIKSLAEKYKDQLDPRAYEALLNYQVEVTD